MADETKKNAQHVVSRHSYIAEACGDRWWEHPGVPPRIETISEDEIKAQLITDGVIESPRRDHKRMSFKRVKVEGESCSETIIRERK